MELSGKKVWIKQFHSEDIKPVKRIHAWVSKLIPIDFAKSSLLVSPQDLVLRERRKYRKFAEAGIPVPELLWCHGTTLVNSDTGRTLYHEIRMVEKQGDAEGKNALLSRFGIALADAHKAGLCHGRPHTRDAFSKGKQIGFFDFEEEPEAVMPLAVAQARDTWLAMFHICSMTQNTEVHQEFLDYWCSVVSNDAVASLKKVNDFTLPVMRFGAKLPFNWQGSDLRRGILSTDFLDRALGRKKLQTEK